MLGIVGGMNIMAGPAGPALLLVHMYKMQVSVAVSEPGECFSGLFLSKSFFMAHEAEFIVIGVIGVIEDGGIILPQYAEVFGAVRVVTAGTVIFPYGTVPVRVLSKDFLHISNTGFPIGVFPVMTAEA